MRIKLLVVSALLLLFLLFLTSAAESKDKKLPSEDDFVICESPAKMKTEATPVYPDSAKANKIEGAVWIKALVDENGKVIEAKVIKCSRKNCGFERAALEAAKKCEYVPASQGGKPVPIWITYQIEFAQAEEPGK
ncbi:MAG: energy transducer TonB [candidate division Zixibacteria bacterium]|nr:energy transducer TonB [candidate division Zixibacteria bacterium]